MLRVREDGDRKSVEELATRHCGDGRIFGGWLRDRAQSYLGVDISSTAVDRAKEQGLEAATISSER